MLRNDSYKDIYEKDVFEDDLGTKGSFDDESTFDVRGLSSESIPSYIMDAYEDYKNSYML